MENGILVTESVNYTKDALFGKWTRWLIFVICSLPFSLIAFTFDPDKIMTGTSVHWELIPWTEIVLLCIAGFLLSFIISGYLARIYRGTTPAPEFDNWGTLYIDGIKVAVTGFLWFVPMGIVLLALFATIFAGFGSESVLPTILAAALVIILIILEIILGIIAVLYSMIGVVRCARTGSIREGIRFTAITGTLRAIGWVNYLITLLVLVAIAFVFFLILSLVALIPYAGWVIELVLTPLYSVFSARYLCRVYDHGMPQATV